MFSNRKHVFGMPCFLTKLSSYRIFNRSIAYLPEIEQYSCITKIEEIHKLYRLLGRKFFSAGRNKDKKVLIEVQQCLEDRYILEKEFWEILSHITNRGCCKTKINMQCYESEKLAEHAVDSDFDHTNEAVPALYL